MRRRSGGGPSRARGDDPSQGLAAGQSVAHFTRVEGAIWVPDLRAIRHYELATDPDLPVRKIPARQDDAALGRSEPSDFGDRPRASGWRVASVGEGAWDRAMRQSLAPLPKPRAVARYWFEPPAG